MHGKFHLFLVNFSISMFNAASLTSVNFMKIAGARFSSKTVIKASQILISFFQFTYKESFPTQSAITCSKLTIERLEQGVKYVQS